MKILICCLLMTVIVSVYGSDDDMEKWREFQIKYGKSYRSLIENRKRFFIFQENLRKIEKHNMLYKQSKSSYIQGMNQYTDWTTKEFLDYVNKGLSGNSKIWGAKFEKTENFKAPTSVDWRNNSAVTGVKEQGSCSASWPFSATGAIEGQLGLKGNLISLSEQNLIDCLPDSGCTGGGSTYAAFNYVKDNGIESEVSYPYKGTEGSCASDSSSILTRIKNFVKIPANDEEALTQAIATAGPIAVAIDATENLARYVGGILDDSICKNDTQNLAVLIVGYGREDHKDYYILKNSWGDKWGEKGYFRLLRNSNNKCAVASMASYPVL